MFLPLLILLATCGYAESVECHCEPPENCSGTNKCSGTHCVAALRTVDDDDKFVQMCSSEAIEEDECVEIGSNMDMNHPGKVCRCKTDFCNTFDMMSKYFLGLAADSPAQPMDDSSRVERSSPPESMDALKKYILEMRNDLKIQKAMTTSQLTIICLTLLLTVISVCLNAYLLHKVKAVLAADRLHRSFVAPSIASAQSSDGVERGKTDKVKATENLPTPAYDHVNPYPNPPHYTKD
ncbi:hypothetical protein QR680_006483 [Steinernema hermaphroditum]|uniref:Activin types I and II receptor domain-containing protein n=1 Tax=Steinernema hermaphroditum TaxID=289476 RepID=A0AA39HVM4_9BILA|nr:hypothetical protein QR680_006483 [Steinernema hermaphroditum]